MSKLCSLFFIRAMQISVTLFKSTVTYLFHFTESSHYLAGHSFNDLYQHRTVLVWQEFNSGLTGIEAIIQGYALNAPSFSEDA